jgi:testis-specific serine kinase
MQHAEKGSILDLIHKERRLSEDRACGFFRQIVAGIDYIHSQGVAHKDIKCENIMLDEDEKVKIIDFGFAKNYKVAPKVTDATPDKNSLPLSQTLKKKEVERDHRLSETYCGSYAYASPEILQGIPHNPFLADVWAIGCVLYAMVFGRLPFDDKDLSKLIKVCSISNLDFLQISTFFSLTASLKPRHLPIVRPSVHQPQDLPPANAFTPQNPLLHRRTQKRSLV